MKAQVLEAQPPEVIYQREPSGESMAERIEAANKKIEDLQSLISEKTARLESLIMNGPELVSAAASRMGEIIESQGLKYIRAICEDLIARAKVLEAQAKKDLAKLLVEAIQTNKEETTTILKKIEEKRAGQSSKKAAAKKVAVVPIETGPASAEETKPAIETERRGAESLSEAEVIMKDFASFAARFGDGLAEAAKVGKKRLVDFIYDRFYSENPDQKLYDEGQPGFSALVEGYSGKMRRLKDYFYNRMIETERSEPLGIIKLPSPDFLYLKTHGGVSDFDRKEMGRLYFNSLPEQTPELFQKLVDELYRAGLHADIKIPLQADQENFNRVDKMVLYFSSAEEAQVLSVVEKFVDASGSLLFKERQPFTQPLTNSRGEIMPGVVFGQEPSQKFVSFGEIRSKILADVYLDAVTANLSVADPAFNLVDSFTRACRRYDVDPEAPSTNLSSRDLSIFQLIRSRAAGPGQALKLAA